jgi:hypothetical protein
MNISQINWIHRSHDLAVVCLFVLCVRFWVSHSRSVKFTQLAQEAGARKKRRFFATSLPSSAPFVRLLPPVRKKAAIHTCRFKKRIQRKLSVPRRLSNSFALNCESGYFLQFKVTSLNINICKPAWICYGGLKHTIPITDVAYVS